MLPHLLTLSVLGAQLWRGRLSSSNRRGGAALLACISVGVEVAGALSLRLFLPSSRGGAALFACLSMGLDVAGALPFCLFLSTSGGKRRSGASGGSGGSGSGSGRDSRRGGGRDEIATGALIRNACACAYIEAPSITNVNILRGILPEVSTCTSFDIRCVCTRVQ